MNNDTALWLALGSAILAILYGLVTTKWILGKPAGLESGAVAVVLTTGPVGIERG